MTRGPIDLDTLTMDAVRAGLLADAPVAVLGLARSGIALARFLADAGARVRVYDHKEVDELASAAQALGHRPIEILAGATVDPAEVLDGAVLVATSPAVSALFPTTEPRLRAALAALSAARAGGDASAPPIVSEVDLFLRLCPAPTIGVTGTKGKTTTASLIAAALAGDAPHPVVLGGNIGRPLIELVGDMTADHRVVIELSELQIPTLSRGTTAAVYTNVTSDHLDRHGSLAAYRAVKARLAELAEPGGLLVLNDDDPVVAAYADRADLTMVRYAIDRIPSGGVGAVDGWIVGPMGERLMATAAIPLPGRHNIGNALAAVAVARWFGVEPAVIQAGIAGFGGVPNRLETVATVDGIRYVNDSQGTQPDAVIAALRAFDPPIVLIAGGRDKDVDLGDLAHVVAERAAAAVLIGESGPALDALFRAAGLSRTARAATMDEAVATAAGIARELRVGGTATVLLSPAAASFDMFIDYEDRGRAFRRAVAVVTHTPIADTEEEQR